MFIKSSDIVAAQVISNLAETVVSAIGVIVHGPVPKQPPPDQPVKVEPESGIAVSVTAVILSYVAEQFTPQFIPEGELVTVPKPVPVFAIVRTAGEIILNPA